jgi:hypothetical protein
MFLQEYIKMPKGEPLVPKVGDRFRPLESNDNVKVGDIASFYEVISVKLDTGLISGYEVMPVYEKITERCP